jgi:hypothetical protein
MSLRQLLCGLACVCALFASNSSDAAIIYRETFGTATTGGQGASQGYDWGLHTGTTAANLSADTSTNQSVNRSANSSKPGTADAIGQVNAGPVIGATPAAYGAGIPFATPAVGNVLFWTPEYPSASGTAGIDPSTLSALTFSWYQGNGNTDGSWRVAIHQGGQWYVSQTQFSNTASVSSAGNFAQGGDDGNGGSSHGSELKSLAYSNSASSWFQLNFDGTFTLGATPGTGTGGAGTVLSLGATPGSNLSGVIDAFGLFSDVPGAAGNRRFDTFTIDAVPEPATMLLAAIGGCALVVAGGRRKS